jgi:hypothetical protein
MKYTLMLLLLHSGISFGQMEGRESELYRLETFRERSPAVGKPIDELTLRDVSGKEVKLSSLRTKPLVIIGGAYT